MRLWSLHPKYLDCKGLVALWRESLLAQKVLAGKTKGYKKHPQLCRFKAHQKPIAAIGSYLYSIYQQADKERYKFSKDKILAIKKKIDKIKVSNKQLLFEFNHLLRKLKKRDPKSYKRLLKIKRPQANPLFKITRGKIADWEKSKKCLTVKRSKR